MAKLAVYNTKGKESEKIDIPDNFSERVNTRVIHSAVLMYQAALRQGNASTKERGEVSGGGRKPHRQKGSGRARAGSTRSPLWVGGGVAFGPKPRDFSYSVPKKVKVAALRESLKAKYQDEQLFCLDDIKEKMTKTKDFASILKSLNIKGKVVGILDGSDESIVLASRNIRNFSIRRAQDLNAYDVMRNKNVLVSKTAIQNLVDRVK